MIIWRPRCKRCPCNLFPLLPKFKLQDMGIPHPLAHIFTSGLWLTQFLWRRQVLISPAHLHLVPWQGGHHFPRYTRNNPQHVGTAVSLRAALHKCVWPPHFLLFLSLNKQYLPVSLIFPFLSHYRSLANLLGTHWELSGCGLPVFPQIPVLKP